MGSTCRTMAWSVSSSSPEKRRGWPTRPKKHVKAGTPSWRSGPATSRASPGTTDTSPRGRRACLVPDACFQEAPAWVSGVRLGTGLTRAVRERHAFDLILEATVVAVLRTVHDECHAAGTEAQSIAVGEAALGAACCSLTAFGEALDVVRLAILSALEAFDRAVEAHAVAIGVAGFDGVAFAGGAAEVVALFRAVRAKGLGRTVLDALRVDGGAVDAARLTVDAGEALRSLAVVGALLGVVGTGRCGHVLTAVRRGDDSAGVRHANATKQRAVDGVAAGAGAIDGALLGFITRPAGDTLAGRRRLVAATEARIDVGAALGGVGARLGGCGILPGHADALRHGVRRQKRIAGDAEQAADGSIDSDLEVRIAAGAAEIRIQGRRFDADDLVTAKASGDQEAGQRQA